jgi:vacuole morphology and inheritance protein 14
LDILCKISITNHNYIELILYKILEKLNYNRNVLASKGLNILTKICSIIPVTKVYLKIADVLLKFNDIYFISSMIKILDIFLLTYKETEELRKLLKNLKCKNKVTISSSSMVSFNGNGNDTGIGTGISHLSGNGSGNFNNINIKEQDFFLKLYSTWCFNPISLLILCMISDHFELSYNLILKL